MKRRILSLLLAIVMVLGMLPTVALAAEEPVYMAAYGTAAADGKLTEGAWLTNGRLSDGSRFGVLWNSENLFVAAEAGALDVTVDGQMASVAADGTVTGITGAEAAVADAAELKLPMAALGLTVADYSQTAALTISNGTGSWSGTLCFTGLVREAEDLNYTLELVRQYNGVGTDSDNLGGEKVTDGHRMYNRYLEDGMNSGSGRVVSGTANNPVPFLANRNSTLTMEYDFVVDAMPEYETYIYGRTYSNYGFSMAVTSSTKEGYICGITNTADGLLFCVLGDSGHMAVPMNKEVGDQFHIRQDWNMDGSLTVYVDGQLLNVFENAEKTVDNMSASGFPNANVLVFNLWSDSRNLESEADNIDFTYSNLKMGTVPMTSPLDGLTFNAIKGDNTDASAVGTDLVLPATWSNGQLAAAELVWESSDPSVIAADGTVTPAVADTEVTLTASLKDDPTVSKSITVTVRQMTLDSLFTDAAITVDGTRGEDWPANRVMNVRSGSNAPYAGVASMWYQEKLYFFINYAYDVNTVTLYLEDQSWTIDLSQTAVNDGALTGVITTSTVELCLDLKAAGLKLMDYGITYDFQIEMEGDNGTASLEAAPIQLAFVIKGENVTAIGTSMVDTSFVTSSFDYKSDPMKYTGTGTISRDYLFTKAISDLDHTKDVQFNQTITVNAMPVSSGAIVSRLGIEGYCVNIAVNALEGRAGLDFITTSVYNSGAEGLKLRVLQGGAGYNTAQHQYVAYTDVTLNKTVGDTFELGIRWNADQSVVVFVDGAEVGNVPYATIWSSSLAAPRVILNYYGRTAASTDTAELLLDDMEFVLCQSAFNSVKEEITRDGLLGHLDLTKVSEDLNLPQSFSSPFLGELPLTWVSSDESIIDSTGKVTLPAGTVGKYVDLELYVGEQKLWTAYAYVLPETIIVPQSPTILGAAFTAAGVTVDNALTDEGWILNTKLLTEAGDQLGRFGAQWDANNLYLAVETGGSELSITLDGEPVTLTQSDVVELAIPFDAPETEYGREIAAVVTLGDASWEGTIVLTSTDWFMTNAAAPSALVGAAMIQGVGSDQPTANQGVERITDGYRFYDSYDPEGSNPAQVREHAIFMPLTAAEIEKYAPFGDRSVASYVEFDVVINSMPEYTLGEATGWDNRWACYGFSWLLTADQIDNYAESVSVGIYNSDKGLIFVALSDKTRTVPLNRYVGDLFRIAVRWETDDSITVFLDGEKLATFDNMTAVRRAMGNRAVNLNMIRSAAAAESRNDNMEVTVTNFAFGKAYGDCLLDGVTWETIKGENTDPYGVASDLVLPNALSNAQLTTDIALTWECSDPAIIAADGTVTKPETGKLVTLTVTAANGQSKSFELFVVGEKLDDTVLYVEKDTDTANGAGQIADFYRFSLDGANNSIIRDLKEIQTVNVIALQDGDSVNRLNESVLTIWVSDDNVTYTQVEGFKLLRSGEYVYLYDFEATGRYIKVHCTHYDAAEADFTGPLQTMIDAYYEEVFGAEGDFTEATVTVTNDGAASYDDVWTLDGEAQRVYLGEELLYHYVEDGETHVRIPEIAAGGSVELKVLTGNEAAMDISNKEYTHEVVYGTREVIDVSGEARWIEAMPDGSLLNVMSVDEDGDGYSNNYIGFNWSYDGGKTWTELQSTGFDYNHCVTVAGVMYDPDCGEQGRIIVQGFSWPTFVAVDGSQSNCKTRFIISDDLGETWYAPEEEMTILGDDTKYYLSYTAPYKVSTADGAGEGVDYVIPMGAQPSTDKSGSFVGRIAYTTDAGLSWTMGESVLSYTGEGWYAYEVGVSEGTIAETDDGKLVYYGRCQFESMNYFAMSVSEDWGKTWSDPVESSVYTVNTQPLFEDFGDMTLLTWAGNTTLGGNSYRRYPLNVAYSTDGLMTFENITNLWSRYSLQGLTQGDNLSVTNQSVSSYDDTLLVTWSRYLMKVDGFTDYFFRSKGAYDSFETSTSKYEGWSTIVGTVEITDEQSTEGDFSMKIVDGASAVRSIPYVQNGSVSFDLYLDDINGILQIELESAYSDVFGEAAPIALEITDGKLAGLPVQQGWNTVTFDFALTEGTANITVNGETAALTPDLEIGDYICYVEIGYGTTVAYVDAFTVVDKDTVEVPAEPEEPEIEKFDVVGANMKLGNDLSMNFFVKASDIAGEGWYAEIVRDDSKTVIALNDSVKDGSYYKLTYPGFAAKEMTDEIVITIYDADGNARSNPWTDSLRAYAMRILVREDAQDSDKTLMVDMLNYGAAAQEKFTYKTEDLANSLLTDEQKAYATASVELTDNRDTGVNYYGSSLNLKSNIQMNVYFTNVTEDMTARITYTNHNGEAKEVTAAVVMSGDYGKVTVESMVVADVYELLTVEVLDGDGNVVAYVIDSVESYCYRTMADQPLNEYLMKFAQSAWKSFHS